MPRRHSTPASLVCWPACSDRFQAKTRANASVLTPLAARDPLPRAVDHSNNNRKHPTGATQRSHAPGIPRRDVGICKVKRISPFRLHKRRTGLQFLPLNIPVKKIEIKACHCSSICGRVSPFVPSRVSFWSGCRPIQEPRSVHDRGRVSVRRRFTQN